ncbi:MAG: hypothetical protein Fur0025_46350 [Oscillatoriaceae cyanobacterium]
MLQPQWQEMNKQVSRLVARAWLSPEFKEDLMRNPKATLARNGVTLPEGVEVEIDTESFNWQIVPSERGEGAIYKLPLPPKPAEISVEVLQGWADGTISERPGMVAKT